MADAAAFQETSSAPARRWLWRAAAVLTAAPLLAGPAQLPAAAAAQAAPSPGGSRTVDVAIDSLTPVSPDEDDTITVRGSVTNEGRSTIADARVDLRSGPSVGSRSALESAAKRTGYSYGADGQPVGGRYDVKLGTLATGITRAFEVKVPADELDLGNPGVYQLGVSLSGKASGQAYEQVLGIERTFLPWQPEKTSKRTKVGFMWPLISTPHLTAQTESDSGREQTPRFRNDELAKELAPGGRLQQLVALGEDLPVTWVIDPDLLASVETMTKDYKVEHPDGSTTEGKNQALAKQWLSDLQRAVEGRELVALPFADPDIASLAHRGKEVSGAIGHLKPATDLAATTVKTILHRQPRTDFAWPVNGAVDTSVVDVATSAGAHNVITRSDSIRETGNLSYTPTAARPIGGGNTALVADARLSTAFQGDLSRAENSTLAVQEFLAQTLMITQQVPGKERSVVVAPQRMPTAGQAQAMAQAVRALDAGRWTEPIDLGDAVEEPSDPRASTQVPGSGSYPSSLRKQELPREAFEEIQRTQDALTRFQVILSEPDRVVTPFGTAMLRQMSTSWRGDSEEAAAFRDSVADHLTDLTQGVQLIQKSKQTLSGRSASIPVTVQNNLVQGVEGLKLVLRSASPHRLDPGEAQPVEIDGGHSQSVKFDTTANANGLVWVEAQLYTEDGRPYGAPMSFQVNVTEITSTVMLVIAGGVLLTVLAGIRMYTQRKRRASVSSAEAAGGTSAAAEAAAGAPGEPAGTTASGEPASTSGAAEPAGAERDAEPAAEPAGTEESTAEPAGAEAPSEGAAPSGREPSDTEPSDSASAAEKPSTEKPSAEAAHAEAAHADEPSGQQSDTGPDTGPETEPDTEPARPPEEPRGAPAAETGNGAAPSDRPEGRRADTGRENGGGAGTGEKVER
ncbi:DUF6049 family protein [Streptomyces sp. Ru87]|uniref:DUF6049 family protein n=1 Tax=Streptomyces sp. Ru87 TaxID=2044307 RepID=UPI00211D8BD6|nr:DUF6049 family protein [Streptomyces sp. Ru87]